MAQHLALGYALTIHKAQGTTVEVGIVVVEPTVSSEQLYVGMSRGRQENRALVVCERDNFDHAGFSSRSPVEVLASVLGHLGAEASAHEVLRANLARSEDPAFLGRLAEEATRHIEACAGPDRSREIKALEPRADVEGARKRLVAAEARVGSASAERQLAERAALEAGGSSLRRRLPGPLGTTARYRGHGRQQDARFALERAQHEEEMASAELSAARRAPARADALDEARRAQERRLQWLATHPAEVDWPKELRRRVVQIHREQTRVAESVLPRTPAQPDEPEYERVLTHSPHRMHRSHEPRGYGRSL